jgi:hypothetical protein
VAFRQSALERSTLDGESLVQHHRAHSTSCVVAMVMISPSWRCNPSTLSVEGGGNVSRSMAAVATFWLALVKAGHWPLSRLVVARAWVAVRSTIRILSSTGVGLCCGGSNAWAAVTVCLSVSLLHCCATSHSVLAC